MTMQLWAPHDLRDLAADGAAEIGDAGAGGGPTAYSARVETARRALKWAARGLRRGADHRLVHG